MNATARADQPFVNALAGLARAAVQLKQSNDESISSLEGEVLEAIQSLQTRASATPTPEYLASLNGDLDALQSGELERIRVACQDLQLKAKHAQLIAGLGNSVGAKVRVTVEVLVGGQAATDCLVRGNPGTIPTESPPEYLFNNPSSPYTGIVAPEVVSFWIERNGVEIDRRLVSVGEDGEPVQSEPVVFNIR